MRDRYSEIAKDCLAQMGCRGLEELLRSAPVARDPDELRLRNACWFAIAQQCRTLVEA